MANQLFDKKARLRRRERAARAPVLFVHERAFDDVLERLSEIRRDFRSALLIGTPDPSWPGRLSAIARDVAAIEPGRSFAEAAGARQLLEDEAEFDAGSFDLCVAMGTLDTLDALPEMLLRIRLWLRPGGLLLGVVPGGDTLPRLRAAMRAADAISGAAAPHVHPRIDAASLCGLLTAAGFQMPVVDVDRVRVGYKSLSRLVADLRGMDATNILVERPRQPLTRAALHAAKASFEANADDGRTIETFELLHFAGWAPDQG